MLPMPIPCIAVSCDADSLPAAIQKCSDWCPRRTGRITTAVAAVLWVFAAAGCGGSSTSDLIERAAARRRPADPAAPTAAPTAQLTAAAPQAAPATAAPPTAGAEPVAAPAANAATAPPGRAEPAIPPIADRRPAQPLNEAERRQRALQNIERIGRALQQYIADKQLLPVQGTHASGGALSWRVALLPYLGYKDLHDQFDPTKPWNAPQHLHLLQQIPDEYVSPERFDEKTNYLAVAGRSYAFDDRPVRVSRVEDGLENTILVIEVEDALAIPWTQPDDYAPPPDDLHYGIGGLRGEGNYALWGNGWPTLLATSLSQQQLQNAFTVDAGDGQTAAEIHQVVEIDPQPDASEMITAAPDEPSAEPSAGPAKKLSAAKSTSPAGRSPIPIAVQVGEASARLRLLYAAQIDSARTPHQQVALAKEMLQQATQMTADPAGAYALLTAAEQMAVEAADVSLATEVLDTKITTFDVDAYRVNADLLLALSRTSGKRRSQALDAAPFIQRAVRVIDVALQQDDYATAASIAEATAQLLTARQPKPLRYLANRLRSQLSTARGYYTRVGDAADRLRRDPSDAEASAHVGMYQCFIKGDWNNGLELLAQSSIAPLAAAARQDRSQPSAPTEILSVADAWWQLSEQARQDVYRQACQERAVHWYRQAHAALPNSLDKLHAQRRIDSATAREAGSPSACLKALAEQLDVDLQQDLVALAAEQQRTDMALGQQAD